MAGFEQREPVGALSVLDLGPPKDGAQDHGGSRVPHGIGDEDGRGDSRQRRRFRHQAQRMPTGVVVVQGRREAVDSSGRDVQLDRIKAARGGQAPPHRRVLGPEAVEGEVGDVGHGDGRTRELSAGAPPGNRPGQRGRRALARRGQVDAWRVDVALEAVGRHAHRLRT